MPAWSCIAAWSWSLQWRQSGFAWNRSRCIENIAQSHWNKIIYFSDDAHSQICHKLNVFTWLSICASCSPKAAKSLLCTFRPQGVPCTELPHQTRFEVIHGRCQNKEQGKLPKFCLWWCWGERYTQMGKGTKGWTWLKYCHVGGRKKPGQNLVAEEDPRYLKKNLSIHDTYKKCQESKSICFCITHYICKLFPIKFMKDS